MAYIAVTDLLEDDAIELPVEQDSTVLEATVAAQFPGATGLRYRAEGGRAWRGLRCDSGKFYEPPEGWSQYIYHVVYPKTETSKRRMEGEVGDAGHPMRKRLVERKCTDLIVLGLPPATTSEELGEYFGKFGELVVTEVKKDQNGQPRGFGFIRYSDYDAQVKVLSQVHHLGDKKVDVKIPTSKGGTSKGQQLYESQKLFVGRIPQGMTGETLRMFFSQYCDVLDVYMPQPHRGFGFVTLSDPNIAEQLFDEDIVIDGHSVHIGSAAPRSQKTQPATGFDGEANGEMASAYTGGYYAPPPYAGRGRGRGFPVRGNQSGAGVGPDVYQAAHEALATALASSMQGGSMPDFNAILGNLAQSPQRGRGIGRSTPKTKGRSSYDGQTVTHGYSGWGGQYPGY